MFQSFQDMLAILASFFFFLPSTYYKVSEIANVLSHCSRHSVCIIVSFININFPLFSIHVGKNHSVIIGSDLSRWPNKERILSYLGLSLFLIFIWHFSSAQHPKKYIPCVSLFFCSSYWNIEESRWMLRLLNQLLKNQLWYKFRRRNKIKLI